MFVDNKFLSYVLAKIPASQIETLDLSITHLDRNPLPNLTQLRQLKWHVNTINELQMLKNFTTLTSLELVCKEMYNINPQQPTETNSGSDSEDSDQDQDQDQDDDKPQTEPSKMRISGKKKKSSNYRSNFRCHNHNI